MSTVGQWVGVRAPLEEGTVMTTTWLPGARRGSSLPVVGLLCALALAGCSTIPEAGVPEAPPPTTSTGEAGPDSTLETPEARSVPEFCQLQERALDLTALDAQPTVQMVDVLQKLRDQAPAAIRQDLNTLVEAFDAAVRDPEGGDRESLALATRAVTSWAERNCGDPDTD